MDQKNKHIEQTVNEHRGRLFNFIRKFVSGNEDAEDILQDVFYQYVAGYEQIRSWEQATAWLFRVARNKITDSYRKKKTQSFSDISPQAGKEGELLMLEDILPDIASLPDRELMGELIWSQLEAILAQMPENQRRVFIWHEFEKKSFKEMANLTGETVNTLISRKRYAILTLRAGLAEVYEDLIKD